MIKQRLYPRTINELKEIVNKYSEGVKSVACQAGHFLVYYDHTEDLLLPGVAEELNGPRHNLIKQEVGFFPILTWELGINLLTSICVGMKSILVVVNDWQYIPKEVERSRFYSIYSDLFPSYDKLLSDTTDINILMPKLLKHGTKTDPFFSETSLRNQYNRNITKTIDSIKLNDEIELFSNGNEIECSLIDTVGRKQEVYCTGKHANCTQEIAELNRQMKKLASNDLFINIFPLVCKEYVTSGTELAFSLFKLKKYTVINIGMPSSGINNYRDIFRNCECIIHC